MPLIGIIAIPKELLHDEELTNLLLDNFTTIEKDEDTFKNRVIILCASDYFDEIEAGDTIPAYHVDIKRDINTGDLYIWRVEKAD